MSKKTIGLALLSAMPLIGQISLVSNPPTCVLNTPNFVCTNRTMLKNSAMPYPFKVDLSGSGTSVAVSCAGTGCAYARVQVCAAGSSPCTPATATPAYVGVAIMGSGWAGATTTYNVAAGTYPISVTVSAAEGCGGVTCVISTNLVILPATYPVFTTPSGTPSGCVSGGSEPSYHTSPNGEKDVCAISNVRPGGSYDMPAFGQTATDPNFGGTRQWLESGTYKRINPSGPRAIGADAVTTQFNADASLVLTNSLPAGTLLATKTDGSGDYWTGLPSGANTWDLADPRVFYYVKSATPTVQKVTLPASCATPPCASGWTDSTIYTYPGGAPVATQLTNGGDGGVSRPGLWPLFTSETTDPAVVLVNVATGSAVTRSLAYEDVPLLCPQNGAAAGNGYYQLVSGISNTTPPVVTTGATNSFATGQTVFLRGSDVPSYNGTWKITVIDSTHFSIPATAAGAGTGGKAIRWVPRLITGAKDFSSDGRYYMILGAYSGGSNYILSWASGETTIRIDGAQAATSSQVLGTDGIGGNTFYDGPPPNHALCDAGYCQYSWHMDIPQAGGDAWLLWPGGVRYPTVVHQYLSRLRDGPSAMETPIEAGGAMIDLQAVGQHDQHQGCAALAPVCIMDQDMDAPDMVAYRITGATNTSPIQITTSSAYAGVNGDVLLVNAVQGNTAANGLCTVQNLAGASFECAGSTGNGVYVANTGSAVKNASPAQQPYQAEIWTINLTNILLGKIYITRAFMHRSWSWNDWYGGGYYGQPHSVISPDGKWAAFESNGGVPDSYNVFLAPTGYRVIPSIEGGAQIVGGASLTQ